MSRDMTNQQNECAPSEDSYQPGHPPSLIGIFTVRMKTPWVLNYPLRTQQRLLSGWAQLYPRFRQIYNWKSLENTPNYIYPQSVSTFILFSVVLFIKFVKMYGISWALYVYTADILSVMGKFYPSKPVIYYPSFRILVELTTIYQTESLQRSGLFH